MVLQQIAEPTQIDGLIRRSCLLSAIGRFFMSLALLSGISLVVRRANCVETMFEPIKHSFHPVFSCTWKNVSSAVARPLTWFLRWSGAFSAAALTLDPDVGHGRASSPQEPGHVPRPNTVVCGRGVGASFSCFVRDSNSQRLAGFCFYYSRIKKGGGQGQYVTQRQIFSFLFFVRPQGEATMMAISIRADTTMRR